MTQYVISEEEKRDKHNSPLYRVHVVDRDAHAANQEHLLFTEAWRLVSQAMQPGDTLTEEHNGAAPISLSYKQVQENNAKWADFDRGE